MVSHLDMLSLLLRVLFSLLILKLKQGVEDLVCESKAEEGSVTRLTLEFLVSNSKEDAEQES